MSSHSIENDEWIGKLTIYLLTYDELIEYEGVCGIHVLSQMGFRVVIR